MRLNYKVRQTGRIPPDDRHEIVEITPYIDPKILGQCRLKSRGRLYVKYLKDLDGLANVHTQAVALLNEGIANDERKEQMQRGLLSAWTFVFNEDCMRLDGNGLYGQGSES